MTPLTWIIALVGLAFISFHWLLIYAHKKIGMTHSISASFDKLEEIGKEWVFQVALITFSTALIVASILMLSSQIMVWKPAVLVISGTLIICSTIAGDTEEHKKLMRNHVYYSVGGIAIAAIFIAISGFLWLAIAGAVATAIMHFAKMKNRTYFIEVLWAYFVMYTIAAIVITFFN